MVPRWENCRPAAAKPSKSQTTASAFLSCGRGDGRRRDTRRGRNDFVLQIIKYTKLQDTLAWANTHTHTHMSACAFHRLAAASPSKDLMNFTASPPTTQFCFHLKFPNLLVIKLHAGSCWPPSKPPRVSRRSARSP